MRRLSGVVLAVSLGLAGCATYEPVPKDYAGPTATVADTGFSEDGSKAQIFALIAIDGNSILNAFSESARASHGRGFSLTTVFPERKVQVRTMRALIRGSHATGAPIHAIASTMAGTFYSVEGTVEFTPEAGRRYLVKGELKKEGSSVWIEEAGTGRPATTVVAQ